MPTIPDFEKLRKEIADMAVTIDKPDLLKQEGMVLQFWSDGELTCQKSGGLLWQRSLHQFRVPIMPGNGFFRFPHEFGKEGATYVVVADGESITPIRIKMAEYLLAYVTHNK